MIGWSGLVLALLLSVSPLDTAVLLGGPAWQQSGQEQQIEKVDVNKATAEQLQKVPGIGPALAGRIIEFREEHGPFKRLEDLLDVRGIGVRTLERLRPYLEVGKAGVPDRRSRT